MKHFKIIGIVLLIVALMVSFSMSAFAQDKKKTEKTITKTKTVKKEADCPHSVKKDCLEKSGKDECCPHSKGDKVFIKNLKSGAKVDDKCKEECLIKCDKAGEKTAVKKEKK